ncbi:MAG TPA: PQQ-binding-like beta-propeller repeat protein [Planctomycetota bacterium]|nr:PQQ-binding-like beta-propeller repeat protein [Planctomycetota bacterium]
MIAAALIALFALAQDWPQFRGPEGQGHSAVKALPVKWTETSENVTWRIPIDGLGWSSPVIAGDRLWLTTATEGGKSLRALCLETKTGKTIHNVEVFRLDAAPGIHKKNSHASPTPILDGDRVYVHFGSNGTACLSDKGQIVWKKVLKYSPVHGSGGSPALHGDLLVVACDGGDTQSVVALDRKTGEQRWKTAREPSSEAKKFSFCTPLVIEVGKSAQVVVPAANGVSSYDPATGKPIWHVKYPGGYSVVPRPVYGNGLLFLSTGFDRPTVLAIRADGKGDVTDTHVAWKLERNAPLEPSPLLVGEELYLVSSAGFASCIDAKSMKVHWTERLGGAHSASPLFAAGMIYILSEDGATTVIKPGTTFTKVEKNQVKGRTFASPVPIEGALFLRTETHLLRIEAEPRK